MNNNLFEPKYPSCKEKGCPFCGCMGDHTCKLYNVIDSAPYLIRDYAESIDYCSRPKAFFKYFEERNSMRKKQSEFERKMIPIAKRKCEKIHNLGGSIFNQYVYEGKTFYGLMGLYEYLSENNIIKKFSEEIIDSYYVFDM